MSFKYLQLAAQLQAEITRGSFSSDKLPTEMELVSTYQVSRQTVRRALDHPVVTRSDRETAGVRVPASGSGPGNAGATVSPLSRLMSMTDIFPTGPPRYPVRSHREAGTPR